jgi:hypothetical protein
MISSGDSPIGISLARQILTHGDYVVAGLVPSSLECNGYRLERFGKFLTEVDSNSEHRWKARFKPIVFDFRCGLGTFWLFTELQPRRIFVWHLG